VHSWRHSFTAHRANVSFKWSWRAKRGASLGSHHALMAGHGGGGGKRKPNPSAFGTSYSPTSKAFIGSNMLFFLNESNFEPLLFYKKRVHNFFMREGVR
jgi:hypothetical protein